MHRSKLQSTTAILYSDRASKTKNTSIPGWTGLNITVRRNAVIVERNTAYLDTIDSPATDLKKQLLKFCVEHPKYVTD